QLRERFAESSLFGYHLSHEQVRSLSQIATYVSHFAVHADGPHLNSTMVVSLSTLTTAALDQFCRSTEFRATPSSAAMRSSSLAKSRPNRSAPGLKITPCLIVKGPLGPSTLMGFVQHQAPSGWRRNRLRNSPLVIMALAPTHRADDTRIQERRLIQARVSFEEMIRPWPGRGSDPQRATIDLNATHWL